MNVVTDDNCATGAPLEAEHDKCIDFFAEVVKHLKIWKMMTLLDTYMRRSSFHTPAVAVIKQLKNYNSHVQMNGRENV